LVGSQTRELGFEQGKGLEVLHALIYLQSGGVKKGLEFLFFWGI
jgi:hypothetical protein